MVREVGVPSFSLGEIRDERKDARRQRVRRHGQTHHGAGVLGDGLLIPSFKEDHCIPRNDFRRADAEMREVLNPSILTIYVSPVRENIMKESH
jgi:hypothetical protein